MAGQSAIYVCALATRLSVCAPMHLEGRFASLLSTGVLHIRVRTEQCAAPVSVGYMTAHVDLAGQEIIVLLMSTNVHRFRVTMARDAQSPVLILTWLSTSTDVNA